MVVEVIIIIITYLIYYCQIKKGGLFGKIVILIM
jgi:hypothetical protein